MLEREGELKLPEDVRRRLVGMSPATIDRLLRTHRYRRPRCPTKPGTKLLQAIPIHTSTDRGEVR